MSRILKVKEWIYLLIGSSLWVAFYVWYLQIGKYYSTVVVANYVWIAGLGAMFLALGVLVLRSSIEYQAARIVMLLLASGKLVFAIGAILAATVGGASWLIAILGEMLVVIGLISFGLINFKARLFGKLFWLPIIIAPIYGYSLQGSADNSTEFAGLVYGLGWLLIAAAAFFEENLED